MSAVPQAYLHAGAEAAIGILLALLERRNSGLGQQVDAAAQAATTFITLSHVLSGPWGAADLERAGGGLKFGAARLRFVYPCKDGFVSSGLFFGSKHGLRSRRLMEVVCAHGFCDEATRDKDWVSYAELLRTGAEPVSELGRVQDAIASFFAAHTRADVARIGQEAGLLLAPLRTTADVAASEQLAARGFWQRIFQPEIGRDVLHPGAFARFSETPIRAGRRAPNIGEHTAEVLCGELGLTNDELVLLRGVGAA
jgi:crotonobetainyl-CoA:carnitine CoA-transferase CaiB-like acyl-CoA transferase